MKTGYQTLILLSKKLDEINPFLSKLKQTDKESFVKSSKALNTGIGIFHEIGIILSSLDDNIFLVNKPLYEIIVPIKNYSSTMLNKYNLVNGYKLYDVLTINIITLKELIDKLVKK